MASPSDDRRAVLPFAPPSFAAAQQHSGGSRRLPPPCWSHDETVALIDCYREKWYSLRRGNLKAPHWQDVASAVCRRCPLVAPPKTAVQCRHKMEKLRKRYRTEVQRSISGPNSHRFTSSWVHFRKMHSMEKGSDPAGEYPPSASTSASDGGGGGDEEEEEEEEEDDSSLKRGFPYNQSFSPLMGNGNAVRIKVGGGSPLPQQRVGGNRGQKAGSNPNPNPNPNWRERSGRRRRGGGGEGGSGREMVEAMRGLGEGYVKMEEMKMEMVREIEGARMEMEMKRTEMILQSQQMLVDAFLKGFAAHSKGKKKTKMGMTLLSSAD